MLSKAEQDALVDPLFTEIAARWDHYAAAISESFCPSCPDIVAEDGTLHPRPGLDGSRRCPRCERTWEVSGDPAMVTCKAASGGHSVWVHVYRPDQRMGVMAVEPRAVITS